MKRTRVAAVTALAAALSLTGTGTTAALWRDEATIDGGTLTAGTLGVSVRPVDETWVDTPEGTRQLHYAVSVQAVGDNLAAKLRLRLEPSPADVGSEGASAAVSLQLDQAGPPVDAHTGEIVVGVVAEGGVWPGPADLPVVTATSDGMVDLHVTFSIDPLAEGFGFPGGGLLARIEQHRPNAAPEGTFGLWSAQASVVVPGVYDAASAFRADGEEASRPERGTE